MQQSQIIHANSQVIQASKGQMSILTQNGQNQQVITQQYGNQPLNQAYRVVIGLGITRIVIGVLCIGMHGVTIAGKTLFWLVGHGFWCGAFFIITGSFGVSAGRSRKKCLIVTHMVLSIVSASLFGPLLIITSAADIGMMYQLLSCADDHFCTTTLGRAAEPVLLCLAVIEFIIDIIAAAFCCKAICCCGQPLVILNDEFSSMQQPQVIAMQNQTMTGGQSGTMYMQPGVGQPMKNQPPSYTQQGAMAYDNQGYNSEAYEQSEKNSKLL